MYIKKGNYGLTFNDTVWILSLVQLYSIKDWKSKEERTCILLLLFLLCHKNDFLNKFGKRENAGYHHFLFFLQCF